MATTKIGCEAYILRDNKLLLGKRGAIYGSGTWALPGGHLEFMERADECLCRELKEELGLKIKPANLRLLAVTDDLSPDSEMHYIHITFRVNIGKQHPKILEPDACEELGWFELDKLPEPFFGPHKKIFETIKTNNTYK